jgi:NADPH:quinone reductase-like Zn-dependent oxidoreductase
MGSGAWAQRAAVLTENLAELPESVSLEAAATLPVAGLTALRALEVGGLVLGRRVLVTGASGGVGRFAIQLAALAGAHVTAVARRTEGLAALGAAEVITELEPEGPAAENFDVVLDGIGGEVLGTTLQRVCAGGTVVSYASTIPDPVSYPARAFFARAPGARLYGLFLFAELAHTRDGGRSLRRLAELLAGGRLRAPVGDAIDALLARRVAGKAVLTVD